MTTQSQVIGNEKYLPVLDKGFVGLIATMGDDAAIVQAARVSYGAGTKSINEDRGLIRYLLRHKHTTPFEMCELKFHVRLPILVARQWIRHRTANVNEESARYSIMTDEFYFPDHDDIQPQSKDNKQGRAGDMSEQDKQNVLDVFRHSYENSNTAYNTLLNKDEYEEVMSPEYPGVAKELARAVMPVGSYTEMYWKIDLHNLFHFLKLRADPHAQKEIRVFAEAMIELARPHFPVAFEAWEDYSRYARNLSRMEVKLLQYIIGWNDYGNIEGSNAIGFYENYTNAKNNKKLQQFAAQHGMSSREMDDFVTDFFV